LTADLIHGDILAHACHRLQFILFGSVDDFETAELTRQQNAILRPLPGIPCRIKSRLFR